MTARTSTVTRGRAWLASADGRWLIAVFAVALAVRLFIALTVTPDPRDGRFDDSVWYDTSARHLAAGEGYVSDLTVWRAPNGDLIYPGQTELTPTALWPPGYPLTLAGIYALTDDSVAAGRMANVLFGALTVALLFLIARRLFDRLTAIMAALALALLPSHVLFTSILLSETYFGFLVALILAAFVYFVLDDARRPSLPLIVGLGALTAFTGYVRGEFMAYGGVLAILMLLHFRTRAALPIGAFAIGALLVVTPWAVRNAIVMDELIVGTTGSGRTAYQGHNPDTDGGPSLIASLELESRFAGLPRKELEIESNREGSRLAREWALDHPWEEVGLVGKRMYLLFRTDEAGVTWLQSNKPWFSPQGADKLIYLSTAAFFGLIALAAASAPIWWRYADRRLWAVLGIVPYYMLVFGVLFIGDPRYHYAMYLPIALFGGVGLAAACRVTAAQWREVAGERTLGSVLRTYGTPER